MNLTIDVFGEWLGGIMCDIGVFFSRELIAELMLHQMHGVGGSQEMEDLSMLPWASSVKGFEQQ